MKQGLEDQTRDQRQGEFIDNQVQKNPNSQQLSPKGCIIIIIIIILFPQFCNVAIGQSGRSRIKFSQIWL